jgi:hypothetical protein
MKKPQRIKLSDVNYAQLVIAGYPKEDNYGIQLQLKEIDDRGYSVSHRDLYLSLKYGSFDEVFTVRDQFKVLKLTDKKVVSGQEVFTYRVDLEDALNKTKGQNLQMKNP